LTPKPASSNRNTRYCRRFGQRCRQQRRQVENQSPSRGLPENQSQQTEQQRHATGEHDQEITYRRRLAARPEAPQADQEVQRQQGELPAEEEQDAVECAEDAQRGRFEQQQQGKVQARRQRRGGGPDPPPGDDRAAEEQRRCRQEKQREAIDTDQIADIEPAHPVRRIEQLEVRVGAIKRRDDQQRTATASTPRCTERDPLRPGGAPQQPRQQRTGHRQRQQDAQQWPGGQLSHG
jgi:hypothetical protein